MGSFLSGLFSVRKADGSLSPQKISGWVTGILSTLMATPGGPELAQAMLASTGKYAPLVLAAVAFFSGAAVNHTPTDTTTK